MKGAGTLILCLAACGDAPASSPDASTVPDAATPSWPDRPDNDGRYCHSDYVGTSLSNDEGGEIRVENSVDPDGSHRVLAHAYFLDDQREERDFASVTVASDLALDCNWVGGTGGRGATQNPAPERVWPFGGSYGERGATTSYRVPGRNYLDVGDKVTLQAEGRDAFTLTPRAKGLTPFAGGVEHDYLYLDNEVPADRVGGKGAVPFGTELTVTLSGSDEVCTREFAFEEVDGMSFAGIHIPPRPYVTKLNGQPAQFSARPDGDNQPASIVIRHERDLEIEFETVEPGTGATTYIGFLAIYQHEPSYELTHYCLFAGAPPLRSVTLPAKTYSEMAPTGSIVLGTIHHNVRSITGSHRIDMVGASTTSASYSFASAP